MTAFRVDTKPLPSVQTEMGSVQVTATPNNPVFGKSTQHPAYMRDPVRRKSSCQKMLSSKMINFLDLSKNWLKK